MELAVKTKSKILPHEDRVLVQRLDGESVTDGGIYIPDNAKEKSAEGMVLAVGPGKLEYGAVRPLKVEEGDRILFGKYTGTDVDVGDESYLLLREEEILAIIVEDEDNV